MITKRVGVYIICIFVAVLLGNSVTFAQSRMFNYSQNSKWSFGLQMGIPYTSFDVGTIVTPVYGMNVDYGINNIFSLQLDANAGMFKSNHRYTWFGRKFKNHFYQISLQPHLNLTRLFNGNLPQRYYMYAFAGVGYIHNNVITGIDPQLAISHGIIPDPFTGKDLHKPDIMFPLGLEMKYFVTNNVSIDLGLQYNLTSANNLDGYEHVTGYVADKNNGLNDQSYFFHAGFSFNIGRFFSRQHMNDDSYYSSSYNLINYYNQPVPSKNDTSITKQNLDALLQSKNQLTYTKSKVDSLIHIISVNSYDYNSHKKSLQDKIFNLKSKIDTLKEKNKNCGKEYQDGNYIIDGAFYSRKRAIHLAQKLKSKGYNKTTILFQDKIWYLVSVDKFKSLKSAHHRIRKLRKVLNPKIWVYIR